MRAAADVMFSLLTSGFSPSLFFPWIQFVLSVQFVLRVWLLLDRSWLAIVRDVNSGTHHMINPSRPSPAFRTARDKSWAWRPGNEASQTLVSCTEGLGMRPAKLLLPCSIWASMREPCIGWACVTLGTFHYLCPDWGISPSPPPLSPRS